MWRPILQDLDEVFRGSRFLRQEGYPAAVLQGLTETSMAVCTEFQENNIQSEAPILFNIVQLCQVGPQPYLPIPPKPGTEFNAFQLGPL